MAGSNQVSVSDTIIADISALKAQTGELARRLEESNLNTQNAIASLGGRLDVMTDLMQTLARLSEKHESHSDGLRRAFDEVGEARAAVSRLSDDEAKWRKDHEDKNNATERRLSMWHGVAIGLSMSFGLATGAVVWGGKTVLSAIHLNVQENRQENRDLDTRIDKLERDAARNHAQ